MKKLIIATLSTASSLMLFAQPINAEVVDSDTSDVGIRFNIDGPEKPGPGPYKDNLTLVWTPSKFDFGKQEPQANIATYSNKVANKQYLVVNDDRDTGEESSAWKITATLSELKATTDKDTLSAKLTFGLSSPQAYAIGEVDEDTNDYLPNHPEGNLSALPEANNIEIANNVVLEAGSTSAVNILSKTKADKYKGGIATTVDNAKLVVVDSKGSAASGKSFKGTVTWNLDNTY